ncbi:MAG: hypothetical protein JEZ02_15485 [Desulfatibacillum sp.]|nr:hypothetical protein [Desulfatibacillum sp.]
MDIRFRPEPPDAVKGVTPVKDQGADRDRWKKRQANTGEKKDSQEESQTSRDEDDKVKARRPAKDDTGRIVDVVI